MERDAFGELENAMINAAVPKKHRIGNSTMQDGSGSTNIMTTSLRGKKASVIRDARDHSKAEESKR
jgi:hypothetical protein